MHYIYAYFRVSFDRKSSTGDTKSMMNNRSFNSDKIKSSVFPVIELASLEAYKTGSFRRFFKTKRTGSMASFASI